MRERPSAVSGVVDVRKLECDETDAEAWELSDPAFGGFTEKVWVISGSPTYVTEIILDVARGKEATSSWCCPPRWNAVPNHL